MKTISTTHQETTTQTPVACVACSETGYGHCGVCQRCQGRIVKMSQDKGKPEVSHFLALIKESRSERRDRLWRKLKKDAFKQHNGFKTTQNNLKRQLKVSQEENFKLKKIIDE